MAKPAVDRVSTAALLRMLGRDDPEEVAAAAIVLGALRPRDPKLVRALGRRLDKAPTHLKPYLLDALARIGGSDSLELLLPYLFCNGSLREQAVRLVASQGIRVLRRLERQIDRGSPEQVRTLVRVASGIPDVRAVDHLVGLLRGADFDLAKYLYGVLRERIRGLDAAGRKRLAGSLVALLEDEPAAGNPTAEIAVLKVLAAVPDPRAVAATLARIDPERPPAVRHNALEVLEQMPLTAARSKAIARRVVPLLDGDEPPSLVALALKVLRRLEPAPLDLERWIALSRSDHSEIARIALGELRRFPKQSVLATLFDALQRPNAAVQSAAAEALGGLPDAVEDLVAAHEDPAFRARQDALRSILANRSAGLSPPRFRRLAGSLLDGTSDADLLKSRLLVLATIERNELNRLVESRARTHLAGGDPGRAIANLEPLVRGRFATPEGRYLLALAHLASRQPGGPQQDGHFDRAMHLLGPLARLGDFDLGKHLLSEAVIDAPRAFELADALSTRPEPERSLGTALRNRHA